MYPRYVDTTVLSDIDMTLDLCGVLDYSWVTVNYQPNWETYYGRSFADDYIVLDG